MSSLEQNYKVMYHTITSLSCLAYQHLPQMVLINDILGGPGAVTRVGRKGATNVFKYGRKSPWVPTLTGPFSKIQADAGSWFGTKNALYYFAQNNFKILSARKLKTLFQNTSLSLQQVFTPASVTSCVNIREFLKDTTTADNHENVAWKREFTFFFSFYRHYSNSLTSSRQANSSGAEFLSTYPSSWREWILSLLVYVPSQNMKLGISTGSRAVDGKEMYKKVWCMCKVVVLPCQAIAYLTFSSPPHLYIPIIYDTLW